MLDLETGNARIMVELVNVSGHPWIVDDRVAPDKPLDSAVLSRLKQFSAMNKLKKMALRVCIGMLHLLLNIFFRNL